DYYCQSVDSSGWLF
nr:immunoglobulin light chain junction region [Macaca mulatta]MOW07213.1 immunoglobulin light chain junction region [Macaca mulatta]